MSDEIKELKLSELSKDHTTRSRDSINDQYVSELVELLNNGVELPPIEVVTDGNCHWVIDGWHRLAAYRLIGRKTIPCNVVHGTHHAAQLQAAASNQTHGLRRTNADKRRAVLMMINLQPGWQNKRIAEHTGTSVQLVKDVRSTVERTSAPPKNQSKIVCDNGEIVAGATNGATKATIQQMTQQFQKTIAETSPMPDSKTILQEMYKIRKEHPEKLLEFVQDVEASVKQQSATATAEWNSEQRRHNLRGLRERLRWCANVANKLELPDELTKILKRAKSMIDAIWSEEEGGK